MQPLNTVDSSFSLADPMFLGVSTLFAIATMFGFGRWLWLLSGLFVRRGLPRKQVFELLILSIPLAMLAGTIAYTVVVFSEAAGWSAER